MITAEMPVRYERKKHKDETLLTLYKNILKASFNRGKDDDIASSGAHC